MLRWVLDIWKIEELRRRLIYTLGILVIYALGTHIPLPGINTPALEEFFNQFNQSIFMLYNIFSGGALGKMTVFALGILPYITASILMQLLTASVPYLKQLQTEEGDYGRYKIQEYTKYLTLFIATVQALFLTVWLQNQTTPDGTPLVYSTGIGFTLQTILILVAGAMFVTWLGERISKHGIGNGSSILIFAGIVAGFPSMVMQIVNTYKTGEISVIDLAVVIIAVLAIVVGIVIIHEAERRIPIQYPQRNLGFGAPTVSYLPIKLNPVSVMPIIFAQAILVMPATFVQLFHFESLSFLQEWFRYDSLVYNIIYVALIILFTYVYASVIVNPQDIAENLRKAGAFIPGVRPGKETEEYLATVINRLLFVGALFLSVIAVIPVIIQIKTHIPFYFGGTTALITVGVALDTLHRIEGHLAMKRYYRFLKG
ncbi:MAG TPA: preprotein translocase subunit SecY [Aquifex aeolicus]|uniref:Protein translocase subunit SecY n=1 Tax=Aquifex aeolicus TaxID=63363 RepID=A0A9D0YQC0_AQUAO|nr:preprotein translocase subunit SecY [Aquificales bacterium]HIP98714.1 preprotein translocase subunit SecY [Aquifex aeolicus]HIQ25903.1 preprotein translocase subunit SecY [Aquifex aeolicus]